MQCFGSLKHFTTPSVYRSVLDPVGGIGMQIVENWIADEVGMHGKMRRSEK